MRKKILIVTSSFPKNKNDFSGIFVYELAKRLVTKYDVYVLCPYCKGLARKENMDGMSIIRHNQFIFNNINLAYGIGLYENLKRNPMLFFTLPFYFTYQLFAIRKIVKKENISLIHAYWLIPNAYIASLYKRFFNKKIPIISSLLGSDLRGFNGSFGKKIKRSALKSINKINVLTNAQKTEFNQSFSGYDVHVIPLGIETSLFHPDKASDELKTQLSVSGPFILFVGILAKAKGIHHLINAMQGVIQRFPNAKLGVIGQGSIKEELISLAEKLNIKDHIIFMGPFKYEELPAYFATADVFCLPSYAEALGMVIAESMSCGTIPVASGFPEDHDILKPDNSFRIEIGNEDDIKNKIIDVLENKEKYKPMIDAGLKHIRANFDWKVILEKYENLISACP